MFLLLCLWMWSPVEPLEPADKAAIEKVFASQIDCWNKGDMTCYMQGYWQSDQLKFIGSRGLTHGWKQTLENYKKSYPDQKTMGTLSFTVLSMEALGPDTAYVIGKWALERGEKSADGYFSLVWKRIDGKWLIVADHSS